MLKMGLALFISVLLGCTSSENNTNSGENSSFSSAASSEVIRCEKPMSVFAQTNSYKKWDIVEWRFDNAGYSGNPFDIYGTAIFTHTQSGEERRTEIFYNGGTEWKVRFTPTQEGQWTLRTESEHAKLNSHTDQFSVGPAEPGRTGFLITQGDKFLLEGRGAIVPQYLMAAEPPLMFRQPEKINEIVSTFIEGHKFNGIHIPVSCAWFNVQTDLCHGINSNSNPDLRTFEVIEQALFKVRQAGGIVHLWMWGDSDHNRNPKNFTGLNTSADRRLQRYLAARLGAIPNWSMGYGYDLWEWVTAAELDNWHGYMKSKLGWNHVLGARGSHKERLHQISENMDYYSYEDFKPGYNFYREAFQKRPGRPVFFEDRFRVNQGPNWAYKDYNYEETRKGLWHSTFAGGSANIWGNVQENWIGHSLVYPDEVKEQIRTYSDFFANRFHVDMSECNDLLSSSGPGAYPVLQAKDQTGAVTEAARYVRDNFPQYFDRDWLDSSKAAYARGQAYYMMKEVINVLRANGWNARRAVSDPNRAAPDPYRWGSDALVIGSSDIYDIYISWPYPAVPHASHHGSQSGELTSDLIALGAGGDPSSGICLGNRDRDQYVFYIENNDTFNFNFSGLKGRQKVIAVDTKKPYAEIASGFFDSGSTIWKAPYVSDWALAVGNFSGGASTGGDLAVNLTHTLYRAFLGRDPDFPGADGHVRNIKRLSRNGGVRVAGYLARSEEFANNMKNLSHEEILSRIYQNMLGREPDDSGKRSYIPMIVAGQADAVVESIAESDEFNSRIQFYNVDGDEFAKYLVNKLYQSVLFRDADPGSAGYVDIIRANELNGLLDVAKVIVGSQEFREGTACKRPEDILNTIYRGVFNRDVDPSGSTFFLPMIREGRIVEVATIILNSKEFYDNTYKNNGSPK